MKDKKTPKELLADKQNELATYKERIEGLKKKITVLESKRLEAVGYLSNEFETITEKLRETKAFLPEAEKQIQILNKEINALQIDISLQDKYEL